MLTDQLRPSIWNEIAGQKDNIRILKALIRNPEDSPKTLIFEGSFGSGKCVVKGTRIHTSLGYIKIEDIPHKENFDSEGFAECECDLYVKDMYKASHFYRGGKKNIIKIKSNRFSLEGTPNHRIKALTNNGVDWVYLNDLKVDDFICLDRNTNILFNNVTKKPEFLSHLSERDYGYFIGFYIGDGICDINYKCINICCSREEAEYIKKLIPNVNWQITKETENESCVTVRFSSVKDIKEFKDLGIGRISYEKKIPEWIYRSNKEFIIGLLSGLVDTDGTADSIDYCTVSKELAYGIKDIFNLMGVYPKLCKSEIKYEYKDKCKHDGISYRLLVRLSEYEDLEFLELRTYKKEKFLELLDKYVYNIDYNFVNNHKKDEMLRCDKYESIIEDMYQTIKMLYKLKNCNESFKSYKEKTKSFGLRGRKCKTFTRKAWYELKDSLPNEYRSIETELDKDLREYRFAKIESIELSCDDVFDLHVPISHTFSANGIINHNTSMARIFAKEINNIKDPNYDLNNSPFYYEYDSTVIGNIDEVKKLRDVFGAGFGDYWKVVVFDECHSVSQQAQNALLKILEEVKTKTFFILATTHVHKVIPTIRSRSLELNFNVVSSFDIIEHLNVIEPKLGISIPDYIKELIAARSGGHMRNVHMLLDKYNIIGVEDFKNTVMSSVDLFCDFFIAARQNNETDVLKYINLLLEIPIEYLKTDFMDFLTKGEYRFSNLPISHSSKIEEMVSLYGNDYNIMIENFLSKWMCFMFETDFHFQCGMLYLFNMVKKQINIKTMGTPMKSMSGKVR